MTHNPRWPLIEEAIAFLDGPNSSAGSPLYWSNVTSRLIGSNATRRGRQYELDQVQSGQYQVQMINTDGALDPDNTSSIYTGLILPYRHYRKRAMSPVGPNLLTSAPPLAVTAISGLISSDMIYDSPPDGGFAVNGTYRSGSITVAVGGAAVTPGTQYTFSDFFSGLITGDVTISVGLRFINAAGAATVTAGPTVAPPAGDYAQYLSVTATAPSDAIGMAGLVTVTVINPDPLNTCAVNFPQLETGPSATTYTAPTWLPVFYGFVERWPQSWTRSGTYGVSTLTVVDGFGYLSQRMLTSAGYGELLAAGASSLFALDEPAGSLQFAEASGVFPPLSPYIGTSATSAQILAGQAMGSPDGPLGVPNKCVGVNSVSGPAGVVGLDMMSSLGVGQPDPGMTNGWTRVWAVKIPTWVVSGAGLALWQGIAANGSSYVVALNSSGYAVLSVNNGAYTTAPSAANLLDGAWHLLAVTVSGDGLTWTLYCEGTPGLPPVYFGYGLTITASSDQRTVMASDRMEGPAFVSCVADYPTVLTSAQLVQILTTFNGNSGSDSGVRYQDILRWAGWAGTPVIDHYPGGQTTDYGPAVELRAAVGSSGTDALSSLQSVVDTENGAHYVDAAGAVTFRARRARYSAPTRTVAATFGENTAAGEIPYDEVAFDFDPTRLTNDVTVTQTSTQYAVRDINAASVANYGSILLQRNANTADALEMSDAAGFLVARYNKPLQRIQKLRVNAAHQTRAGTFTSAAWTALLGLELGSLVNVNRRPPGRPAMTYQGIAEQINWTMNSQGDAYVDLEVSSALGLQFWIVGQARLVLHAAASAGATTLVVDALPDAAVNRFEANVSASSVAGTVDYQWMDPNGNGLWITAITPTVVGYTTATITVVPPLPASLPAGTVLLDMFGVTEGSSLWTQCVSAPVNEFDPYAKVGVSTIVGY